MSFERGLIGAPLSTSGEGVAHPGGRFDRHRHEARHYPHPSVLLHELGLRETFREAHRGTTVLSDAPVLENLRGEQTARVLEVLEVVAIPAVPAVESIPMPSTTVETSPDALPVLRGMIMGGSYRERLEALTSGLVRGRK